MKRKRSLLELGIFFLVIIFFIFIDLYTCYCQNNAVPTTTELNNVKNIWHNWDVIPGRVLIKYNQHKADLIKTNSGNSGIPGLYLTGIEDSIESSFNKTFPQKKYTRLLPNTFIGSFEINNFEKIITVLKSDPEIEYFEPDRTRFVRRDWGTSNPNDPGWQNGLLWGMSRIHAPEGWIQQPAVISPIRVAIMEEDAIDLLHQDLIQQRSQMQNNANATGDHATHVAGIVAATGNNNIDVVGVANVELVSLAVGSMGSEFAQNIAWAFNNGINVINMSWGWCNCSDCNNCPGCNYPGPSQTEQDAITNASTNIIFVAAASNDTCNTDPNGMSPIPVSYNGVLGVSALTQQDTKAAFSNFGSYVDLTAPGVSILSTILNNGTASWAGTSMAAPHVAGTAAAILVVEPNYDIPSINRLLTLTAEDIGVSGRDDDFGWGVVRVDDAIAGIADVYADSNSPIPFGVGTLVIPFNVFNLAINAVPESGILGFVRGSNFGGAITISKPCTLISVGGVSTLGQQ